MLRVPSDSEGTDGKAILCCSLPACSFYKAWETSISILDAVQCKFFNYFMVIQIHNEHGGTGRRNLLAYEWLQTHWYSVSSIWFLMDTITSITGWRYLQLYGHFFALPIGISFYTLSRRCHTYLTCTRERLHRSILLVLVKYLLGSPSAHRRTHVSIETLNSR